MGVNYVGLNLHEKISIDVFAKNSFIVSVDGCEIHWLIIVHQMDEWLNLIENLWKTLILIDFALIVIKCFFI